MAKPAKRIYRDDEEPENETVALWDASGCRFCGGEDHEVAECLVRPLSDWMT